MTEYLRVSQLRERSADYPDAAGMIEDLLADHETVTRSLRQAVDRPGEFDAGTVDFLTVTIKEHEEIAWILRSLLSR